MDGQRRVAVVVSILKVEASAAEAVRRHGLTVAKIEDWREKFLLVAENALRARPKDDEAFKDEQIKKLKQKIGLTQESIAPYTPEQGSIERFFRSLKEECVWQYHFQTYEEARQIIHDWIVWYNERRPHSALGNLLAGPTSARPSPAHCEANCTSCSAG